MKRKKKKLNGKIISLTGSEFWYKDGCLHRIDGPAVTHSGGSMFWYKDGLLHREDGPAVINSLGAQTWHKDGKIHRDDGPAYISKEGKEYWHKGGLPYEPSAHETMTWKLYEKQNNQTEKQNKQS